MLTLPAFSMKKTAIFEVQSEKQNRYLMLAVAILLGLAVRLPFVLNTDFPLNDGGLFFTMVRELQANHFRLPLFTSYNGANIPFAYPPLAFYLAGILQSLTQWNLLSIFRFMPFFLNLLCIPAFYSLALAFFPKRPIAGWAVIFFALLPRSFQWLIMGGGLTRALGFFFSILAIRYIYLLFRCHKQRNLLFAAAFSGFTALSHPEMVYFVACTASIFCVLFVRDLRNFWNAVLLAVGTALVAALWWVPVLYYHGIAPLMSASLHGTLLYNGLQILLVHGPSSEQFVPLSTLLALLGMIESVARKKALIPLWILGVFLFDPRSALTISTVPLAMLMAVGLDRISQLFWGPLNSAKQPPIFGKNVMPDDNTTFNGLFRFLALAALVCYLLFSTINGNTEILSSLPRGEREAMRWIAENTPSEAIFVTVPAEFWAADRSGEWFPVLARRTNISTVQGSEWLDGNRFASRIKRHEELRNCAAVGSTCLDSWMSQYGEKADYIYIPKRRSAESTVWSLQSGDCCKALINSLSNAERYALIYEGDGAVIYRRS